MKFENTKIHIALIISAATGLMYEIVATNMLFFYFKQNTYSISTVLAVFMFGLGIGSIAIYTYQNKIQHKRYLFGLLQILISIYAFALLVNLTSILPSFHQGGIFVTSFIVLVIPTAMLGAIFPLAGAIMKSESRDVTGLVYAFDLSGAVLGALLSGFILIPLCGNQNTIFFGAFLNLIAAMTMFKWRGRSLCCAVSAVLLFVVITYNNAITNVIDSSFKKDSPYGLVEVRDSTLYIDGRDQCSNSYGEQTAEKKIVDYALEHFETNDINVLNVGLGCGLTLSEIVENVERNIDVVEINPVVIEANRYVSSILKNSKVNIIIDDGLHYLRNTRKKYDAVIMDVENPSAVSSSNLFTVEAFQVIDRVLSRNGVLGLWIYGCSSEIYYDTIYKTLKQVFPYVSRVDKFVFVASNIELGHPNYLVTNDRIEVNTLDKKVLSKIYFHECAEWFNRDSQYILKP